MSEDTANEQPPIFPRVDTDIPREFTREGRVLWENEKCQVILPDRPLTPKKEGIHMRVVLKKELPPFWDEETEPKEVLYAFGIGLGVAETLAESDASGSNIWANLQLGSEWGGQHEPVIDIFGRSGEGTVKGSTWAQPALLPSAAILPQQELAESEIAALQNELKIRLDRWNKALGEVSLFPTGVGNDDLGKVTHGGEQMHWVGDQYYITSVDRAHVLGGGHLVVHKRPETGKLPRIWDDPKAALEIAALDIATVQILKKAGIIPGGRPNVSILFAGNWALPYSQRDTIDPNSKLTDEERVLLDRLNRAIDSDQPLGDKSKVKEGLKRVAAHGHIYWTRGEKERFVLPALPDPTDELGAIAAQKQASELSHKGTYQWIHKHSSLAPEVRTRITPSLQTNLSTLITRRFAGKVS